MDFWNRLKLYVKKNIKYNSSLDIEEFSYEYRGTIYKMDFDIAAMILDSFEMGESNYNDYIKENDYNRLLRIENQTLREELEDLQLKLNILNETPKNNKDISNLYEDENSKDLPS